MGTTFANEKQFEDALIRTLVHEKGWTGGVISFPTERDLVENWANILFENNNTPERLNGCPLTEGEMRQLLDQLNRAQSPAEINRIINGKVMQITRDCAADTRNCGHTVSLHIYDRLEIAGGNSIYQIARQPKFNASDTVYPKRRGDLMLLINGLPVIHIELKKAGVSYTQAVNQIGKYMHEGVFRGFFGLVQFFVAMNPDECVYFANPGERKFVADGNVINPLFQFHWETFDNEIVNDWRDIAEGLLSIPMAHQMVGFYTVADSSDDTLKILRSYQYWAVAKIRQAVDDTVWGQAHPMGGYIWHTTGSGKTMTSFKAAQLLAQSKKVDRVVFLVDRVELGNQSLHNYRGFADDEKDVIDTENSEKLKSYLLPPKHARATIDGNRTEFGRTLIVTSIQKMNNVCNDSTFTEDDFETFANMRIVFIVDECHRSVFGDMMIGLKDKFPCALLFGFTGTPIEAENAVKKCTTSDVFGNELARYTIVDAMRDGNVLVFDVSQVTTHPDEEVRRAVALEKAKVETEQEALEDPEKRKIYLKWMREVPMAGKVNEETGKYEKGVEDELPRNQYDRDEHRTAVVDDILSRWDMMSVARKFHAIFATSSINEAIEYYRLFKKTAPEGFKMTGLFYPSIDNEANSIFKEEGLAEIIRDYNAMFKQSFTISTWDDFKENVSHRIAHKEEYKHIEHTPEAQLDLLIVVDQMLTGFDSKWINTLYLDKVLRYQMVIQAFSRTNRLFGREKPFGSIRYYRKPHTMKRNIAQALKMYSGEKPPAIFVPKLDLQIAEINRQLEVITEVFTSEGIENFAKLPTSEAGRKKFAKAFIEMNAALDAARIQGFRFEQAEYDVEVELENGTTTVHAVCELDGDTYLDLVLRYKELAEARPDDDNGGVDDEPPYDIDPTLTTIDTSRIDSQYMEEKFQKWVRTVESGSEEDKERALNELHSQFSHLSAGDQALAEKVITQIWDGSLVVDESWSLRDLIDVEKKREDTVNVDELVRAFGFDKDALTALMELCPTEKNLNDYGRFDDVIDTLDIEAAKQYCDEVSGRDVRKKDVSRIAYATARMFVLDGTTDVKAEVLRELG